MLKQGHLKRSLIPYSSIWMQLNYINRVGRVRRFNSGCLIPARPGATGGHIGAVPPQMIACAPKQKLCPPKRGLCPEEINRLGATGVQIEAQIGIFCGLTPDFMTFWG